MSNEEIGRQQLEALRQKCATQFENGDLWEAQASFGGAVALAAYLDASGIAVDPWKPAPEITNRLRDEFESLQETVVEEIESALRGLGVRP